MKPPIQIPVVDPAPIQLVLGLAVGIRVKRHRRRPVWQLPAPEQGRRAA